MRYISYCGNIYYKNNNFSITRVENNDNTNCEYNVYFKQNN